MIVLHALWSRDGELCLWGEDSALPSTAPRPRARQPKVPRPRPHPFACTPESLCVAIGDAGGALVLDALVETELTLLLPTIASAPQSSPQLLREVEAETTDPDQLAPWTVPVFTLDPTAALDLLLALEAEPRGAVRIGDSLRYFAEVAKLAIELVARGSVVPGLEREEGEFVALWRPVLAAETERLPLLLSAMPAVCRAEWEEGAEPAGRSPRRILYDCLRALTDACMGEALAESPLLPPRRGRRPAALRPAEAWLEALGDEEPQVSGDAAALAELKRTLDDWAATAAPDPQTAPLRTCFRLSPPPEPEAESAGKARTRKAAAPGAWRLEFLLQATDDPSLQVPAERVWKARGDALTVLRRKLDNPQEKLLGDLGRALRIFPPLEPALRTARPAALELDAQSAYDFLRQAAPLLEQTGFGVLVPPWWKKPTAKLGVRLKTSPSATSSNTGLLGLEGIVAYQWEVALGDETLSFEEFRKLAQLKVPLVRVRGQWVELKREEIEAALALFTKHGAGGEMSAAEALRLAAGIDESPAGLPVLGIEAEGWLGELLGSEGDGDTRLRALPAPKEFQGKLRPYQKRGLSWLAFHDRLHLGACLADDMGLGKTIQLLALLLAQRKGADGGAEGRGATLLICPMSVVGNWQREAARFAPDLRVHVHHGAERASGEEFREAVRASDLVITTYALAARDREELAALEWERVVLDEAQNIKNPAAKQTQAIRGLPAAHRVALTGTPVENRLSELWSIMEFLNPGLLGSASDFRRRFATPIERYRDEERAAQLRRLTGPFVLRRVKSDRRIIRDLPEKLEMKVFCNLTREQASLYQATVDDMLAQIENSEGIERKGLVLTTMLRLKQVCNHPAQLLQDRSALEGRSGKLARLEEILGEVLDIGDRALVFTQFAEMGHMLRAHLQRHLGREVLYLHGGTSMQARDEMVARFQGRDGPPVFLLSLKAGGTGLNLTAANHVVHFDRWWNPAVENQATDRAFRIGQTKNVQVRKLICTGTLEERIDLMIEAKQELAEWVVGTGEAWLTELSTAELRAVLTLSRDAVAE